MPQKVNLHLCSLSVDRTPDILRPAWHEGQMAGDFDCSAQFSLGEHQTEGRKKNPALVIIHIHAVEFAPVCSEQEKSAVSHLNKLGSAAVFFAPEKMWLFLA